MAFTFFFFLFLLLLETFYLDSRLNRLRYQRLLKYKKHTVGVKYSLDDQYCVVSISIFSAISKNMVCYEFCLVRCIHTNRFCCNSFSDVYELTLPLKMIGKLLSIANNAYLRNLHKAELDTPNWNGIKFPVGSHDISRLSIQNGVSQFSWLLRRATWRFCLNCFYHNSRKFWLCILKTKTRTCTPLGHISNVDTAIPVVHITHFRQKNWDTPLRSERRDIYIYICIYIEREREREKERGMYDERMCTLIIIYVMITGAWWYPADCGVSSGEKTSLLLRWRERSVPLHVSILAHCINGNFQYALYFNSN